MVCSNAGDCKDFESYPPITDANPVCCATWSCDNIAGDLITCTPKIALGKNIANGIGGYCNIKCSNGDYLKLAVASLTLSIFALFAWILSLTE